MTNFNVTNMLLRIVSNDNPEHLSKFSPKSRKKAIVMATLVLIPVSMWILTGWIIGREFTNLNQTQSVFLALGLGIIIFILEKAILNSDGNKYLSVIRALFGILFALVGGEMLNSQLFKKDIHTYAVQQAEKKTKQDADSIRQLYHDDLSKYRENQNMYQNMYLNMTEKFIAEADGSGGTGSRGLGDIARAKNQTALSYLDKSQLFDSLTEAIQQKIDTALAQNLVYNNALFVQTGPLEKLNALHHVAFSNTSNALIFIVITLLTLMLELIVLAFKSTTVKSAYEEALEYKEVYLKAQLQLMKKKAALHHKQRMLDELIADKNQYGSLI